MCPREYWAVVLHTISLISMIFASLKGLPQNSKRQSGFCFGFFRGEIDHPPWFFLDFHRGNRLKKGKMYEALTAMVLL